MRTHSSNVRAQGELAVDIALTGTRCQTYLLSTTLGSIHVPLQFLQDILNAAFAPRRVASSLGFEKEPGTGCLPEDAAPLFRRQGLNIPMVTAQPTKR